MATLNDIVDALMTTISSTTGLRCVELSDNPPAPCAMVYPNDQIEGAYYKAFRRGVFECDVLAHVVVPAGNSPRSAQRALNDYLSPDGSKSIAQAVHERPTLGTDADENPAGSATMTAHVAQVTEYGFVTSADGTRLLGAKVQVHVVCRGDA